MKPRLHHLPARLGGAAENMALDFLLLQRCPPAGEARFRHYGWHRPAFTFGYSQKLGFVRSQLPDGGPYDLCRRPTGGGIVDHREDWTYSLVVPRGYAMEDIRATQSYREIHACLSAALKAQGVPAELKPASADPAGPLIAGVCFERAELYDIVNAATGRKIAGAAQKRNKHGLLVQGSLWRPAAGDGLDWEKLERDFAAGIAGIMGAPLERAPWPELDEGEVAGLIESYSSAEWNEAR